MFTGHEVTWTEVRWLATLVFALYGGIAYGIGYFALHVPGADKDNAAWVMACGAILILCSILTAPYRR